jgi:ubiquinone/menaquinone biosynthesis C-methylase UbiE
MRLRLAFVFLAVAGCKKSEPQPAAPRAPETATAPAPSPAPATATAPARPAETPGGLPPSANPGINDRYKTADGRAASKKVFEGSERGAFQKPADVIKLMKLKKGDVVADVGAGTGYMTAALSRAVGARGKVFAEDITAGFLDEVRAKVEQEKLANVEVILGTTTDTKLPTGCCDVILVLDTYHHFEWPEPMLASMKRALKPQGRLVIVEFHRKSNTMFETLKIDYEQHIRLADHEVVAQIEKLGWKRLEKKEFPPYQYVAVFTPAAEATK